MKQRKIYLLSCLVILVFFILIYSVKPQTFGIAINVADTSGPIVNLGFPLNNSGITANSVFLHYNASDASDLDNCTLFFNDILNASNLSVTKDVPSNFGINGLTPDKYNWSINCADQLGFEARSGIKRFFYIIFDGFNGSTTNISNVDVTSITNFVIEVLPYGKINYSIGINLNEVQEINGNVNISYNNITLNSSLAALNKTAVLSLYNLAFLNPRILRDGVVCDSSICTRISYSGGTLVFNVTGFSSYSADETPSSGSSSPGGGGGSGGGSSGGGGGSLEGLQSATEKNLVVDRESIKIQLLQGETKEAEFFVKHEGFTKYIVSIYSQNLDNFIKISDGLFELQPGETRQVKIMFSSRDTDKPDVYIGRILVKSGSVVKEITTVVEIIPKTTELLMSLKVYDDYRQALKKGEVQFQINMENAGNSGGLSGSLYYALRDGEGNELSSSTEQISFEGKMSIIRALQLPRDIRPGTYVIYSRFSSGEITAASFEWFKIGDLSAELQEPSGLSRNFDMKYIIIAIGAATGIFVLIGIADFYLNFRSRKKKEKKPQ